MNKIVSTKRPSAIFLAIVLVTGTITALSPSFITGANAQAQPYYGLDSKHNSYGPPQYLDRNNHYNSYEPDYGMDSIYDDRKSYGNDNGYDKSKYQPSYKPDYKPKYPSYGEKDDRRDKSKDSKSVNINKIKCINTNLNINGNNTGDINLGNKGQVAAGGYSGVSSSGSGGYGSEGYYDGYNNKQGKGFDCIINNNNTNNNVVGGGGNVTDACEECFNANATLAEIITDILELPGEISLFPVFPDISIGANVATIAQLCDYFEEQISEGIIPQTGLIDVIIAILERDSEISADVSEESVQALYECLLDVDFG